MSTRGNHMPTYTGTFHPATRAQAAPFIAEARQALGPTATPSTLAGWVSRAMLAHGLTNGFTLAIVLLQPRPTRSSPSPKQASFF